MADKAKGPVILLVLLLVIAVAAAFLGFIALQKEKEINANLTEENRNLEVKKRSAEKQAEDLKRQIENLNQEIGQQKAKIQDYENKISEINNELNSEKEAKDSALAEVSRVRDASESIKRDKSILENKLMAAQRELDEIRGKLAALEGAKKPEEAKTAAAEVELEKIVVAPKPQEAGAVSAAPVAAPALAAGPLEGKVLVVNREYDFIVINLGQKDGVNLGDTFSVLRKDKSLGEAKVEEVRDTMSVASPGAKEMIKQIKEDDRVVRK